MGSYTINEIISLLRSIREEIDNSKNKNKSPEVRNHYLDNAKRYTEIIEVEILRGISCEKATFEAGKDLK